MYTYVYYINSVLYFVKSEYFASGDTSSSTHASAIFTYPAVHFINTEQIKIYIYISIESS